MDVDFFATYTISPLLVQAHKRIACAQYLADQNKKPELIRLCQLAGFLIRDVEFEDDVLEYRKEIEKCRGIHDLAQDCDKIHAFMLRHITKSSHQMHFK